MEDLYQNAENISLHCDKSCDSCNLYDVCEGAISHIIPEVYMEELRDLTEN